MKDLQQTKAQTNSKHKNQWKLKMPIKRDDLSHWWAYTITLIIPLTKSKDTWTLQRQYDAIETL